MSTIWIHCNKCFAVCNKKIKLYVSACSHIYCQNCVRFLENNNNICIICKRKAKVMLLSNDLNQDVKKFFIPITQTLKAFVDVINFQVTNQLSLLKHEILAKQMDKQIITKYAKQNEALIAEMAKLKAENTKLKAMLMGRSSNSMDVSRSFCTSTPRNNSSLQKSINQFNTSNNTLVSSIKNSQSPSFQNLRNNSMRKFPTPYDKKSESSKMPHVVPNQKLLQKGNSTSSSSMSFLSSSSRFRK